MKVENRGEKNPDSGKWSGAQEDELKWVQIHLLWLRWDCWSAEPEALQHGVKCTGLIQELEKLTEGTIGLLGTDSCNEGPLWSTRACVNDGVWCCTCTLQIWLQSLWVAHVDQQHTEKGKVGNTVQQNKGQQLALNWDAMWEASLQVALVVKNHPANAGDISGFSPWAGKITWKRAWQPSLVLLPGESHGRATWTATVHRVTKSRTRLRQLGLHTQTW